MIKRSTYTRDDFETIPAQHPAPVETWIVAINSQWMAAFSRVAEGGDADAAFARARDYYPEEDAPIAAMTLDQLQDWQKRRMAEHPEAQPQRIDAERFQAMLNVLPPMQWHNGDFEHFKMCEMYNGSWTTQFGRVGEKYAEKLVNVRDRSTWLTAAEVEAANA